MFLDIGDDEVFIRLGILGLASGTGRNLARSVPDVFPVDGVKNVLVGLADALQLLPDLACELLQHGMHSWIDERNVRVGLAGRIGLPKRAWWNRHRAGSRRFGSEALGKARTFRVRQGRFGRTRLGKERAHRSFPKTAGKGTLDASLVDGRADELPDRAEGHGLPIALVERALLFRCGKCIRIDARNVQTAFQPRAGLQRIRENRGTGNGIVELLLPQFDLVA